MPQVAIATCAVLGLPILAVAFLRDSGAVTAFIPLVAAGVLLSVAISYLGAAFWSTRAGSGDTVFADLMLWGWLRRLYLERQLASAVRLLGGKGSSEDASAGMGSAQRVRLLKQLAAGLEARYPDSSGHSRRVARHAAVIAKRMGLSPREVARIRTAAAVHDVGKVEVPSELVNKPGKLTDVEFAVVKRHAEVGGQMVRGLGDEELARIVRHHHERIDGAGYPEGLAGEDIPLGSRIIAVADTFDAITSNRSYRPAMRHKEALAALAAGAGTQLDKEAVRAFRGYYSGLRPVAIWALLLNGPRQLLPALAAEVKVAGAVSAAALAGLAAGDVAPHIPQAQNGSRPATLPSARALADADLPAGTAAGDSAGVPGASGGLRANGRHDRAAAVGAAAERGSSGTGAPSNGGSGGSNGIAVTGGAPNSGSESGGGGSGERGSNLSESGGNGNSGSNGSDNRGEKSPGDVVSDVTGPAGPAAEAAVAAATGKAAEVARGAESAASPDPPAPGAAVHGASSDALAK